MYHFIIINNTTTQTQVKTHEKLGLHAANVLNNLKTYQMIVQIPHQVFNVMMDQKIALLS